MKGNWWYLGVLGLVLLGAGVYIIARATVRQVPLPPPPSLTALVQRNAVYNASQRQESRGIATSFRVIAHRRYGQIEAVIFTWGAGLRFGHLGYGIVRHTLGGLKYVAGFDLSPPVPINGQVSPSLVLDGTPQTTQRFPTAVGLILAPGIAAVSATFDTGRTVTDSPSNGVFFLVSPGAHAACALQVHGAGGKVLGHYKLWQGYFLGGKLAGAGYCRSKGPARLSLSDAG